MDTKNNFSIVVTLIFTALLLLSVMAFAVDDSTSTVHSVSHSIDIIPKQDLIHGVQEIEMNQAVRQKIHAHMSDSATAFEVKGSFQPVSMDQIWDQPDYEEEINDLFDNLY